MLTPQKKPWSWSLTPRMDQSGSGASGSAQGFSTPRNLSQTPAAEQAGDLNKDALCQKITSLENELLEYQYNMGLLLIEKKDWTSQYEEVKRELAATADDYRREQAAHLIAIAEAEKREESLRTALGTQKLCVADLEKNLREMRSEHAEIKFTADSKLAEAQALVASVEQKSLEVEAKMHATEAKLAEVDRKVSEVERKSQELVAFDNTLRRERLSFTTECGVQEANLAKQREELREWEQKLQEAEERFAESRRLLNQREQRANENDSIWKQKQKELEETREKVDAANLSLKEKEEEFTERQASLILMEKEADKLKMSLEGKVKELNELEEKLNLREKVEMEKLLKEHKVVLDAKEKEFELELEQKRKSADEELKTKAAEVEKKEAELNHVEEKIRKREQALEKKMEKLKEKESEYEVKSKALKEKEKSFKIEEKNMEKERKKIISEEEKLLALKTELEKIKSDIESRQLKICEETELLKLTEDERSEHARLQLELKQEIDKCRIQREQLLKEAEDLRHERLRFEKEWEELDEKSAVYKKEFKDVADEKKNFEKFKWSEQERLINEKLETQDYVKRELEALELARESFTANMEHERTVLNEKIQSERSQLLNEFEMQKREFESERESQQEEMENRLREMEKSFEEKREAELNNINHLRDVARREREEMKAERHAMDKEKQEISANKEQLEMQHREMRKDIDELVGLSQKLKAQREQFIRERERFISFVENLKSCGSCEELINQFVLADLQSLNQMDNVEVHVPARVADRYLKDAVQDTAPLVNTYQLGSPGAMSSWLRKCTTRMFKFSPAKQGEPDPAQALNDGNMPRNLASVVSKKLDLGSEIEPEISVGIANDSLDNESIQSDYSIRELEAGPDPSFDDQRSQQSVAKLRKRKPAARGNRRATRASSRQEVVEDEKAIRTEAVIDDKSQDANGGDVHMGDQIVGESEAPGKGRKRNRTNISQAVSSGHNDEYSGHSGNVVSEGQRRRKKRAVQPVQAIVEKRYNLRLRSAAAAASSNGIPPDNRKSKETESGRSRTSKENISSSKATPSNTLEAAGVREEIRDSNTALGANEDAGSVKGDQAHEFSADSLNESKGAVIAHEGVSNTADIAEGDASEEINGTPEMDKENSNVDDKGEVEGDLTTSEEVNGAPKLEAKKGNVENEGESFDEEDDEDDDDDEDEEVVHPGEASLGKKIWKLLIS